MGDSGKRFRMDRVVNALSALGGGDDASRYGRPGHPLQGRLSTEEIRQLRSTSDLVQRIIEELPRDAMRPGAKIRNRATGEVVDETKPASAFWADLFEAACNGRAYGTGYLLYLTDQPMSTYKNPLDPMNPGGLLGTIPLDVDEVSARRRKLTREDLAAEGVRFGWPVTYSISPVGSQGAYAMVGGYEVHTSRLSKFPGQPLDRTARLQRSDDHDDSVIHAVWDAVRQFLATENAAAQLVQRAETGVYKIPGLENILAGDGEDLLIERLRLIQVTMSLINAIMVDSENGGDYRRDFASFAGIPEIWDRLALSVAKAARMPMTRLFGMAPAGLAGDDASGRAMWRNQVSDYQKQVLEPALLAYYRHLHPGVDLVVEFGDIDELTPGERAEVNERHAKTITSLLATGAISPVEARQMMVEAGLAPPNFDPEATEDTTRTGQSVQGNTGDQPGTSAPEDPMRGTGAVAAERNDADTFKAPEAARNNAKKVLRWKEEHGDEVKGMTQTGWTRARQLASNANLSRETVGRMAAFARHRKNATVAPEYKDEPWKDAGYVAWLGWGGSTGVAWAAEIVGRDDDRYIHTDDYRWAMNWLRDQRDDKDPPADPDERVKGSKANKEGSASGERGGIEINEATEKALRNKVDEHNEKHGDVASKKTNLGALKAVYRRGAGAFSTSHRKGMTRGQWAMARVNSYLYLLRNGRPENAKYTTDYDLLPASHPKSTKDD